MAESSPALVTLGLLQGKAEVSVFSGAYRGMDGLRALVDFAGGRVPAHLIGPRPSVNEPVWVMVVDAVAYVLGPTVPKPAVGTVVSASSGSAVISTDIGNVNARYDPAQVTLSASAEVRLVWGGGCWVLGVSSPPPEADVPDEDAGVTRKTRTFTATGSGSWQSGYGWRTNDVWSSSSNKGAWFYGNQIRDTIPDSASIVKAEIYLPAPTTRIGSTRPFGRHSYSSQPGGEPTISATSTLPGVEGWTRIPSSLIDHLKSNAGGLGFGIGSWWVWPGTQKNGSSGKLRVVYET